MWAVLVRVDPLMKLRFQWEKLYDHRNRLRKFVKNDIRVFWPLPEIHSYVSILMRRFLVVH